jgi:hypothetical protein
LVKIGLTYFVPNYFHQLPRPFREFIKTDVLVTTRSVPSGLSRRPCRQGEFDHGIDHQESRKQLKV